MSKITGDTQCPACAAKGGDKSANHLMLFEDGGGYCNRCEYVQAPTEPQKLSKPTTGATGMNIQDVQKLPIRKLLGRGIDEDIAKRYGIHTECNTANGEEAVHYYPITIKGKVAAYRARRLPKEFYSVGESLKGKAAELFGQNECQRSGKKLLITGGQDDFLAASQMLTRYTDSKYGQGKYPPNVVSLTTGENTKSVADNLDFINGYEEVLIYTDMDDVGRKCASDIAKLIGPKAKIVETTEKDANDMLLKGKQAEFINAFFSAKAYTPVGIVEGGIPREELRQPIKKGLVIPTLPGTMEKMKGFRQSELTIVLAPAGVGKTTIMKEVGYALNKQAQKIVHIFLEEELKKTQQSYIAIDNDVSLARYRRDPTTISEEAFNKSYDELIEGQLWTSHWGSMKPEKVMETLRYAASWGADFGILDHVSMVFSGTETTNERKEIDMLLTQMAAFTKECPMHLIVVSHIKRQDKRWKPKDYPYWETVASDAGRGSGAFEQLADNIITLEVEYLDEDMNKGRIRTRVAKNREWAMLGVGDVLGYNQETGRIKPETMRVGSY